MKRPPSTVPGERAPRSRWVDPRFGIGVALVLASVAGVVALVSSADRTVPVWSARDAISPGDTVTTDDLVLRKVALGESVRLYLGDSAVPDAGVIATRAVSAGELVPVSAVGHVALLYSEVIANRVIAAIRKAAIPV